MINLGHHPGESDVGYENVAFTRGSGSIEGSVHFTGKDQLLIYLAKPRDMLGVR